MQNRVEVHISLLIIRNKKTTQTKTTNHLAKPECVLYNKMSKTKNHTKGSKQAVQATIEDT